MDQKATGSSYVFRAFVSYSHRDQRFARKLHRRLESYRLPKGVDGGGRLGRIYLDKEELGAATNLPAAIQHALASSECLVVIASRSSLRSKWVSQEITTFRQIRPDGQILYIAAPDQLDHDYEPLFVTAVLPGTQPMDMPAQPRVVSVDNDGFDDASLAIIAGLFGRGFDELRNRERTRRQQALRARMALALSVMMLITLLGALSVAAAIKATREKERALSGQSELLATQSTEALRSNDATLAMRLALAGMPKSGDRPYRWQSAVALSRAAQKMREQLVVSSAGEHFQLFAPSKRISGRRYIVTSNGALLVQGAESSRRVALNLSKPAVGTAFYLRKSGRIIVLSDKQVVIWDETSEKQTQTTLLGTATCMTASPDEKTITIAIGNRVEVLNLPDLSPLHSVVFQEGDAVACAVFSARNHSILAGLYNSKKQNVLELVDLKTSLHMLVGTLADMVINIALAPSEASSAIVAGDGTVWSASMSANELRNAADTLAPALAMPVTVSFNEDGSALLVGDVDGAIHVFDAVSLKRTSVFAEHADSVTSIHVVGKDGPVYSASNNGVAKAWTFEPLQKQQTLLPRSPTTRALGSPSGHYVATATRQGEIMVWNMTDTAQLRFTIKACTDYVRALAISETSNMVAAACDNGQIYGLSLSSATPAQLLHDTKAMPKQLTFTVGGDLLFAAANGQFGRRGRDGRVTVKTSPSGVESIAAVPSSSAVLVTDNQGDAIVYDMANAQTLRTFKAPRRGVQQSTGGAKGIISGNGKLAWIASGDSVLSCWELDSGKMLATYWTPSLYSNSISAGPDDEIAFTVGARVHYWKLGMSEPRAFSKVVTASSVRFMPGDGSRLASATIRGMLWFMDVGSGDPYAFVQLATGSHETLYDDELILGRGAKPYVAMAASDGLVLADLPLPPSELIATIQRKSPSAALQLSIGDLGRFFLPMESILGRTEPPLIGYAPLDNLLDSFLKTVGN